MLKTILKSHIWLVTGKWIHNRASLWYVYYTSVKLFNKIERVLAIVGAYDSGLDGH